MGLSDEELDALAERVADLLAERLEQTPGPRSGMVTAREVAKELKLERGWVYDNRERLGGSKLGPGRGAPVRFNLARVRELIDSGEVSVPQAKKRRAPRSRRSQTAANGLQPGAKMIKPRGAR